MQTSSANLINNAERPKGFGGKNPRSKMVHSGEFSTCLKVTELCVFHGNSNKNMN